MKSKKVRKKMPGHYLYSVELTVNDCDLWTYPEQLKDVEDKKTFIRFQMNPSIVLEITEDEFLDQVNCDTMVVKNTMFSLSEQQINAEVDAKIVVSKLICAGNEVVIGCYNIPKLNCNFKRIMEQFDIQAGKPCAGDPCVEVVKELVQLVNCKDQPSGSVHYTLRLACFGPTTTKNKYDDCSLKSINSEVESVSTNCTTATQKPQTKSREPENSFDEYAADINGNQIILRVLKGEKSRLVTRVYGTETDRTGENLLSISGCNQHFDVKFPNASCGDLNGKSKSDRGCKKNSLLTDFQRNGSKSNRELEGKCKLPKGIELCRKGCADPDSDVFILKIGKKNSIKKGQQNEIEIEMRTPKGPDNEVRKMETREVQVDEKEFEVEKKPLQKPDIPQATKGFVKKSDASDAKGLIRKKK